MTRSQKQFCIVLIVIALLASVHVAMKRVAIERANRTVAFALDYDEAATLAAMAGKPVADVLGELKAAGVTHLAIGERTLLDTINQGDIELKHIDDTVSLTSGSPLILTRVKRNLDAKLPDSASSARAPLPAAPGAAGEIVRPRLTAAALKLGVGYPEDAIRAAKQAGLYPVARPISDFASTPQAVECSLAEARRIGAEIVVFQGTMALGDRDLLKQTAETMARLGLKWGYIELVPQAGADKLAAIMKAHILRTHSISDLEMVETTPDRGIGRFSLAVRERNVRLCYVRLMLTASPTVYEDNLSYVRGLAADLKDDGFSLGPPELFPDFAPHKAVLAVVLLGIVGGSLWLIQMIFCLPFRWFWGLAAVACLAAIGAGLTGMNALLQITGLAAAVVFPTLGLLILRPPVDASGKRPSILRGVGALVVATAITAIGGMLIVGSLSSLATMMQVEQFRGIKLATIVPLFLVSVIQAARFTNAYRDTRIEMGEDGSEWPALWAGLRETSEGVIRYWHAGVILALAAVLALVLWRSGNQPPVKVSGSELQARNTLEKVFVVRPRTKELAMHPVLVLSAMLMFAGRRRGVWLGFVGATIGQVSALNTFCHLHTPLTFSLIRDFNGLWLGAVLGVALWGFWLAGEALWRRWTPEAA